MKKSFCFIVFICFSQLAFGQNLVPNPSFEDFDTCPNTSSQIRFASGWRSFCNTPDYYNFCSTIQDWSVPSNSAGYQKPSTETCKAYIGLYSTFITINNPEYAGVELYMPLSIGYRYYVSFKINLSNLSNCATNNMGALFSTKIFNEPVASSIRNYAHIYAAQIIADTLEWITVSGSFIADSAYKYILLGNFFSDSLTSKLILYGSSCNTPYYLIDDVCVSLDSLVCNTYSLNCNSSILEKNMEESISIRPNPFIDKATISINTTEIFDFIVINIIDIYGRTISTNKHKYSQKIEICRNDILPGVYYISVNLNFKTYIQKIVITN